MSSKADKGSAKPAASAAAQPTKKTAKERDVFGSRPATQAARINAALSAKPATDEELAEEAKLGLARVRAHLKYLVGKGLVTKSEKGFALK